MENIILILISISLVIFAFIQWTKYRDILHPICLQSFFIAIFLGIRVFYIFSGNSTKMLDGVDITEFLLPAIIFYLGFFIIATFIYKVLRKLFPQLRNINYKIRNIRRHGNDAIIIAIVYLVVCVIALIYLISQTDLILFINNIKDDRVIFTGNYFLYYAISFFPVISMIILYSQILTKNRKITTKIAFIVALFLSIIGSILSGFRGVIFNVGISIIVLYHLINKRISLKVIFLLITVAVIFFPIMDSIVYGGLGSDLIYGNISDVTNYYQAHAANTIEYIYGRYYTLEGTARTLYFIGNGSVPFDNGRFLINFFPNLLPTVFLGSKLSVSQEITRTFFPDIFGYDSTTSAFTSLPAFMYWQAGWLGYLFAAFLYGFFMYFWTSIYENKSIGNAILMASTYPFFWMEFIGATNEIIEFIYLQIILFPILYITFKNSHYPIPRIKNNKDEILNKISLTTNLNK